MNDTIDYLFSVPIEKCKECYSKKQFSQELAEIYRIKVIDSLKQIANWNVSESCDERGKEFLGNCRALATGALINCNLSCSDGKPEVANYLEETINSEDTTNLRGRVQ